MARQRKGHEVAKDSKPDLGQVVQIMDIFTLHKQTGLSFVCAKYDKIEERGKGRGSLDPVLG